MLLVDVSAFSQHLGDSGREPIRNEIVLLEGILNRIREVWCARLALVELERVALDVIRRSRGQANVDRVELRERSLPGAVNRSVALVGNDDVEVAGRVVLHATDHRLQQRHGDLLLLAGHA